MRRGNGGLHVAETLRTAGRSHFGEAGTAFTDRGWGSGRVPVASSPMVRMIVRSVHSGGLMKPMPLANAIRNALVFGVSLSFAATALASAPQQSATSGDTQSKPDRSEEHTSELQSRGHLVR